MVLTELDGHMQKKHPEFLNLITYRNQIQMHHKLTGEKLNNKISIKFE